MTILDSHSVDLAEPVGAGRERFSNILATSTSILSLERNREEFQKILRQADVLMLTVDLDGVFFHKYDQMGRPIDEATDEWTDPMTSKELKAIGVSLQYLQKECEQKGIKLIFALNSNREVGIAKKVFDELPDEIVDHCLATLEAGHVSAFLDRKGNLVAQSHPDTDSKIAPLKQAIFKDLQTAFTEGMFGKLSYRPFRQGMITYRNVDPSFVGWDDEAKTVSGPLLTILQQHGYPDNKDFKVAYYLFDGGLDIQFTKYSKRTGEIDLIDTATDLDLVKDGERVIQVHFGDTWSDALNGAGTTPKGICYDVFTFAVANSQQRLLDHAKVASSSANRWGVYEGIKFVESMLVKSSPKERINVNRSMIQLLQSYLGPESPTENDFNLREVVGKIDLKRAERLIEMVKTIKQKDGRVFIIGNGGSYDNARLISLLLRTNGVNADVPGSGQKYLQAGLTLGHDFIFESTLGEQKLNENDLLITISGSGNSPNILRAIEFAKRQNASVFALGGRDGGQMCKLTGLENAFVVQSPTMEIIEDVHTVFGFLVATAINTAEGQTAKVLADQRDQAVFDIEQLLKRENVQAMASILIAIEKTLLTKGRIIIVGDSIGVNHVRADMARGATNQLPFKLRVVENPAGSTNSSLATQNDDGPNFVLVHGLETIRPEKEDIVIILNSPSKTQDKNLQLCHDLAVDSKATTFLIGNDLPNQPAEVIFTGEQADYELLTTIMADLIGRTLHEHLVESMGIKIQEFEFQSLPKEISSWLVDRIDSDRKLGARDTLIFEEKLRSQKLLPPGKVIVFCYGKMFMVDFPEKFGIERAYY